MSKPFEITLSITATVRWLEPSTSIVDKVRRKYIQGRVTYIAYLLTESLQKAIKILLEGHE